MQKTDVIRQTLYLPMPVVVFQMHQTGDTMDAGQKLRSVRESLGLAMREVEAAAEALALKYGNPEFAIPISRLSDMEIKGITPSIFRLYALSVIYRRDYAEVLSWYGVELSHTVADYGVTEIRRTHRVAISNVLPLHLPVKMDPGFDLRRTSNIGRMIEKWGLVPAAALESLADSKLTYGYIGSEDFTMYPIVLPGSLVQVDETRNKVVEQMWHSEYERPIYFVEMRDSFVCCWCSLQGADLVLQPHPLSPVPPRTVRNQVDAEVIGQVVGIAMRLDQFDQRARQREPRGPRQLN